MRTGCLPWTLTIEETKKKTARSTCTFDPAVSRHAAQDCPCLQFLGPGKGAWFRLAKRSRHLGLPCFVLRLGLWRWYQCSNVAKISEFISCHHVVRAPITLLDIQSKVAIACQCNSFPAIISRCFCQHFFIFWGTIFGSPFWAPFLVPRTILRENLTGAGSKMGPRFWDPKIASFLIFFSQKRFSSHGQKHALAGCTATLYFWV